jgi:hypothetical protein
MVVSLLFLWGFSARQPQLVTASIEVNQPPVGPEDR